MDFELILSGFLSVVRETALLTLQVLPYLLVGAAGAGLQALLSQRWSGWLFGGRGARPLLTATSAAALLPGCSCATMPMAAGLKGNVVPRLGTLAAFIFMSPLLSPITVALTWALLGWEMTVARVAFSVIGSFALGLLVTAGERWLSADHRLEPAAADACGTGGCALAGAACTPTSQPRFWPSFGSILRSVTPYFLLGMLIAGAISALLPEDSIPRYLGGAAGVSAYLLAALVGIPMYVCEGEEVPITFALVASGLGSGPAPTFLLGSVGTCIPTILMARRIIGRRATVFYTAFWLVFAVAAGMAFQVVSG